MKLAIVTGGSRGLGKALVEHYEGQGWTMLELSRSGKGAHNFPLDLTDPDATLPELEKRFQTLAETAWERVVFINNAGQLTPIAPVYKLNDAQIEHNLAANLVSAIRVIAAFVRVFRPTGYPVTIANISSGAALKGYAGWPLYCAAKAGMENFMRSLAAECVAADSAVPITCINIEPGVVDTAMQAEIRSAQPEHFPE
ncbi:MAG: SDR family NAD(P)-dependent oxidoreductase, partial [Burkholderiaceae bacterium]|nr:SDR family NAD(P)-dependent oxidoreductase [Burkholderiaceae bacterium]